VASTQIQGCWIVGEQLKNFPVWSSVCFVGMKLHDVNANAGVSEGDNENFSQICKDMEKSKNQIVRVKQNSTWAMALCCADLVKAILNNTNEVRTVSVMVKDHFGIDKEVFLSVPCALNSGGVGSFLNVKFNEQELKMLRNSSSVIDEVQKGINF
jgi:L-lactate dehydrogenase